MRGILKILGMVSATGYAFPGVVLAIGVVSFSGGVDATLQLIYEYILGIPFTGFLIGSVGLLIFSYVADGTMNRVLQNTELYKKRGDELPSLCL